MGGREALHLKQLHDFILRLISNSDLKNEWRDWRGPCGTHFSLGYLVQNRRVSNPASTATSSRSFSL